MDECHPVRDYARGLAPPLGVYPVAAAPKQRSAETAKSVRDAFLPRTARTRWRQAPSVAKHTNPGALRRCARHSARSHFAQAPYKAVTGNATNHAPRSAAGAPSRALHARSGVLRSEPAGFHLHAKRRASGTRRRPKCERMRPAKSFSRTRIGPLERPTAVSRSGRSPGGVVSGRPERSTLHLR
jgi:hypothetical protein